MNEQNQSQINYSQPPSGNNQPSQPKKWLIVITYFIIATGGYYFILRLTEELSWYSTRRFILFIYYGIIFFIPITLAKGVFKDVNLIGKVLLGLGMAWNLLLFLATFFMNVD